MGAGFITEEGIRPFTRHGAFVATGESRSVVGAILDRAVRQVVVRCHYAKLSLPRSLFEIAVGHGARRVVVGDKVLADVFRELVAPQVRL